jgi:hypothetical protein
MLLYIFRCDNSEKRGKGNIPILGLCNQFLFKGCGDYKLDEAPEPLVVVVGHNQV